jgi:predicted nucleotidyltransferase
MRLDGALRILRDHEADLRGMGLQSLYVFGSTARGEQNPDSDVDLFFDYQQGTLGLFQLMDIRDAASRMLGCKADIMTRGSIDRLVRRAAEAEAIAVF